jgi:hypothetical protein
MAFAQLTYRESLRDIETCLRALQPKLYHAGIRAPISRSTLAEANESRDYRIYADFAQVLISQARDLYAQEDFGVALEQTAYVFDSTTIDLCLALFPWAHFRKHKGAVKIHTLMDLHGSIPCFIRITHGKIHDVTVLDDLVLEPGSFYILDRGYIDFKRLYRFHQSWPFYYPRQEQSGLQPSDLSSGRNRRDFRTIKRFDFGSKTSQEYPELYVGSVTSMSIPKEVRVSTNNLPASLVIAQLANAAGRWNLFKWIKQHLRIKAFYGTSENAVKTQIWIAISVYVLVAILKKKLNVDRSLSEILQILSVTLFQKADVYQLLIETKRQKEEHESDNQLILFNP